MTCNHNSIISIGMDTGTVFRVPVLLVNVFLIVAIVFMVFGIYTYLKESK